MPNFGHGGRPPKGVDDYKDEILDRLHGQNWKQPEIVTWLEDNKDIVIDVRTLQRRLQKWGEGLQDRTKDTEELRSRIRYLFCRDGLNDKEMLEKLYNEEFTITMRGLVRIRKELGLRRLETSREIREHMDEVVRDMIEEELGKGVIQRYGRGYLVEHFRKLGHPVKRYSSYDYLIYIC